MAKKEEWEEEFENNFYNNGVLDCKLAKKKQKQFIKSLLAEKDKEMLGMLEDLYFNDNILSILQRFLDEELFDEYMKKYHNKPRGSRGFYNEKIKEAINIQLEELKQRLTNK